MVELDDLARSMGAFGARAYETLVRLDSHEARCEFFGDGGPGRLGELGHALSAQHAAAVHARRGEIGQVIHVAEDLSDAMSTAATGYRHLEARRAEPR